MKQDIFLTTRPGIKHVTAYSARQELYHVTTIAHIWTVLKINVALTLSQSDRNFEGGYRTVLQRKPKNTFVIVSVWSIFYNFMVSYLAVIIIDSWKRSFSPYCPFSNINWTSLLCLGPLCNKLFLWHPSQNLVFDMCFRGLFIMF